MGLLSKIFYKKNDKINFNNVERKNEYDKIVVSSIYELMTINEDNETKENKQIIKEKKEYMLPELNLIKNDNSKEIIPFINKMLENNETCIPIGKHNDDILIEKISNMPNLLISGTVMSGKSSYINSILFSMLFTRTPYDLKLIIFDSKGIEYSQYNNLPHLMVPIITDEKKLLLVLNKIKVEIERRYEILKVSNEKNITNYNNNLDARLVKIPDIVVVMDDYTNLALTDMINDYTEYISKNGWNVNIYMIVVANHPSSKIISTISKSNFPARISFRVISKKDSMVILDKLGAERLTGFGSALYNSRFSNELVKIQIPTVFEEDIKNLADYYNNLQISKYDETLIMDDEEVLVTPNIESFYSGYDTEEPLYNEIVEFVVTQGKASASLLQRRFRLGYNRASRCIDLLEERGIIGPPNGSKPREVLVKIKKEEE